MSFNRYHQNDTTSRRNKSCHRSNLFMGESTERKVVTESHEDKWIRIMNHLNQRHDEKKCRARIYQWMEMKDMKRFITLDNTTGQDVFGLDTLHRLFLTIFGLPATQKEKEEQKALNNDESKIEYRDCWKLLYTRDGDWCLDFEYPYSSGLYSDEMEIGKIRARVYIFRREIYLTCPCCGGDNWYWPMIWDDDQLLFNGICLALSIKCRERRKKYC